MGHPSGGNQKCNSSSRNNTSTADLATDSENSIPVSIHNVENNPNRNNDFFSEFQESSSKNDPEIDSQLMSQLFSKMMSSERDSTTSHNSSVDSSKSIDKVQTSHSPLLPNPANTASTYSALQFNFFPNSNSKPFEDDKGCPQRNSHHESNLKILPAKEQATGSLESEKQGNGSSDRTGVKSGLAQPAHPEYPVGPFKTNVNVHTVQPTHHMKLFQPKKGEMVKMQVCKLCWPKYFSEKLSGSDTCSINNHEWMDYLEVVKVCGKVFEHRDPPKPFSRELCPRKIRGQCPGDSSCHYPHSQEELMYWDYLTQQALLNHLNDQTLTSAPYNVIHMKGIPFGASREEVLNFFQGLRIDFEMDGGVHFVPFATRLHQGLCYSWELYGTCPQGDRCMFKHGDTDLRPVHKQQPGEKGQQVEVYVVFVDEETARTALQKDRQYIGHRYVDLSLATVPQLCLRLNLEIPDKYKATKPSEASKRSRRNSLTFPDLSRGYSSPPAAPAPQAAPKKLVGLANPAAPAMGLANPNPQLFPMPNAYSLAELSHLNAFGLNMAGLGMGPVNQFALGGLGVAGGSGSNVYALAQSQAQAGLPFPRLPEGAPTAALYVFAFW